MAAAATDLPRPSGQAPPERAGPPVSRRPDGSCGRRGRRASPASSSRCCSRRRCCSCGTSPCSTPTDAELVRQFATGQDLAARHRRAVPGAVRRDHVPVVHRGHPRPDRGARGPLLRDRLLRQRAALRGHPVRRDGRRELAGRGRPLPRPGRPVGARGRGHPRALLHPAVRLRRPAPPPSSCWRCRRSASRAACSRAGSAGPATSSASSCSSSWPSGTGSSWCCPPGSPSISLYILRRERVPPAGGVGPTPVEPSWRSSRCWSRATRSSQLASNGSPWVRRSCSSSSASCCRTTSSAGSRWSRMRSPSSSWPRRP